MASQLHFPNPKSSHGRYQNVKNEVQIDKVLDLRGWSCPWCIVKARSWLSRMKPGQILELLGTDPEALKNLPSVLKNGNDRIIEVEKYPDHHRLLIRRG